MFGEEITSPPSFYRISIDISADKHTIEDVEQISRELHTILTKSEIYHSKPEITNCYDDCYETSEKQA